MNGGRFHPAPNTINWPQAIARLEALERHLGLRPDGLLRSFPPRRTHAERVRAAVRARSLLLDVLDEDQQRTWLAHGRIWLRGQRRWRSYLIVNGAQMNVWRYFLGMPVWRFCAVMRDPALPREDMIAAQVIALRHNERYFRKTALSGPCWKGPRSVSIPPAHPKDWLRRINPLI